MPYIHNAEKFTSSYDLYDKLHTIVEVLIKVIRQETERSQVIYVGFVCNSLKRFLRKLSEKSYFLIDNTIKKTYSSVMFQ